MFAMAHHVVPALIHTHATRPNVIGGSTSTTRSQNGAATNPPDADAALEADFVACKSRVQRGILCISFFVMQLVIVVNVKDTVILCRIFIGLSTALILIQLVRCSMSIFCARASNTLNNNSDPLDRRCYSPRPRSLLHREEFSPPSQMTTTGVATILPHLTPEVHYPFALPRLNPGIICPLTLPHLNPELAYQFTNNQRTLTESSSRSQTRQRDDPPPYHLALTLPQPHPHAGTSMPETPPPSYEKLLPALV